MTRAALLLLAAGAVASAADWEHVGERDGVLVERRSVAGSSIRELRATAHSTAPPARVMATLWKHEEYPDFLPYVIHLDVLRDEGDTRLIYEQLRVPFAKDRDVVLRIQRSAADGVYEVSTATVSDEGPPPNDKFVRVRTSRSHWRLDPAPDGGTDVTYTVATDAGGIVPGWIIGAIQKDGTTKVLRALLDRAEGRTRR